MMTRELYKEQLRKLNGQLIQMGDLCEEAMSLVMKALREKDDEIAAGVHRIEQEIDQKERDIESMCMKLLLRQQPVAGDLRNISAALRMIADMERIGDQTADIADISKYVTNFQFEVHPSIFKMGKVVSKMVNDSVNAFVRKEEKLARQVIDTDDEVDRLFEVVKRELVDDIRKNKDREQEGYELDILMVAKYLERIGDHAVNLGEWVVYSIQGNMF
ncbi:MAG: phosphate signaling complex protein PhoU [Oliverpabstia sp.]|nr:phosphate signaling complex protein PhoU [Lachnospiraceae bacterium]MDY5026987.1 phosphate signaling complex protein PhoU [Oliverpabstia sp.]